MARVRVLTMKFPRVTKIGQSIASMRTTPQVSGYSLLVSDQNNKRSYPFIDVLLHVELNVL